MLLHPAYKISLQQKFLHVFEKKVQVLLRLHQEQNRATFDPVWRASVERLQVDIGAGTPSIPASVVEVIDGMKVDTPKPPDTAKFVIEEKTIVAFLIYFRKHVYIARYLKRQNKK